MDKEEELRRLVFLDSQQLGLTSRRNRLIAEVLCSSAASIVEESLELRATARRLCEEATRLRRGRQKRQE